MILQLQIGRLADLSIGVFLAILILFSPLVYGSITILPLSVLETISVVTLILFLLKKFSESDPSFVRIPFLGIILFFSLVILQILPLTNSLLAFLSSSTLGLYKNFSPDKEGLLTLSIYLDPTLSFFLQLLSYLAVFFAALDYANTQKRIRSLAGIIAIAGSLYAFYGIIRMSSISQGRFSTFTNANHFAAYLGMTIPLTTLYVLTMPSRSVKFFVFIVMACAQIIALFLTLSRAGIICIVLSVSAMFLVLIMKKPLKKVMALLLILFAFLTLSLWIMGAHPVFEEIISSANPAAIKPRLSFIKDSMKIFKDFPLFGTGLGTFGEIFPKYQTAYNDISVRFAHNEFIQLLVETGALGVVFLASFFILYFKKIVSLWDKRRNPFAVYITLGCLMGILSVSLHSLFDFNFHIPANTILFFIILAITYRAVYIKEPQGSLPVPEIKISLSVYFRYTFVLVSIIILLPVGSLIWKRCQAELIFEKLKDQKIVSSGIYGILEYKRALKNINKAIVLNPLNSSYPNKKAEILAELALRKDMETELQSLDDFKGAQNILRLAELSYKRAIILNPTYVDYHMRLGWLYSVSDNQALSKKEFDKAILLDPQNPRIKSYLKENFR